MEILAYGEDALTLWALKNRLPQILPSLNDFSNPAKCRVLFRPSFGRGRGFGEFDFILLSQTRLYLGESKWDRSAEKIEAGNLNLRSEQLRRHEWFKFYVEEWAFGPYASWPEFAAAAGVKLQQKGLGKTIAPANSLLAENLQTVLALIKAYYPALPEIRNVLWYFHDGTAAGKLPRQAGRDFTVVPIDYSGSLSGHFIKIEE